MCIIVIVKIIIINNCYILNIIKVTNLSFKCVFKYMFSSKEHNLFEIEIFCNIINVFTVTFDQLSVPC